MNVQFNNKFYLTYLGFYKKKKKTGISEYWGTLREDPKFHGLFASDTRQKPLYLLHQKIPPGKVIILSKNNWLLLQTAMDQLHMHFTSAIHNTAFKKVLGFVELYAGTGDSNFQKRQYNDLCKVSTFIFTHFFSWNLPLSSQVVLSHLMYIPHLEEVLKLTVDFPIVVSVWKWDNLWLRYRHVPDMITVFQMNRPNGQQCLAKT